MQKRKQWLFTKRITGSAVLLAYTVIIGLFGCQQPTKQLTPPSKHEKKAAGVPKKPAGSHGKEESYHNLTIPKTLSRTSAELQEKIIAEHKTGESVVTVNKDGTPIKYIEKEVCYDLSAAFSDNLLLDPSNNSIYPGAILAGDSIDSGNYREILNGNKRPVVISFSLQGVKDKNGKPGVTSGEITPRLAAYRKLHNEILSQKITYDASANSSYEETDIKNEENFNMSFKLGVGFSAAKFKTKIAAGLKFKSEEKKQRYLIKFIETFYTVDVDQESAPLMTNIPREIVGPYMPVYVASVSYGRIAYLSIVSDKTWKDIKPHIDMVFKATTTNNAEAKVEKAIAALQADTSTAINIIGGSNEAVTTLAQFRKYIVKGGFASGNPGQIIKYKLRFLDDNTLAHIRYGGQYKTIKRVPVTGQLKISGTVRQVSCQGFPAGISIANVSGTIGIQPEKKNEQKQMIFDYNGTTPATTLNVDCNRPSLPKNQKNSILVPDKSAGVRLSFDINIKERKKNFDIDQEWKTDMSITHNVSDLIDLANPKQKRSRRFTVEKKGQPQKKINFDIDFAASYEFPQES